MRLRWDHVGLGLLVFSLYLSPVAHRVPQDVWQPRSLPVVRHDPEPQDTWRSGALLIRDASSRAVGHVAALEPALTEGQGLVLLDMWRHVGAASYLGLKLVRRVPNM
jgi:hypothetical protein